MFGNLGELAKMMSKAKDIQANLKKFKEEMPTMEFSTSSPGCQVRVTVTGDFRIKEISLTDEALEACDWRRQLRVFPAACRDVECCRRDALLVRETRSLLGVGVLVGV